MNDKQLLGLIYELHYNAETLSHLITEQQMYDKMIELGYGEKEFHIVGSFIDQLFTNDKFEEYLKEEAFNRYVSAIETILQGAKMAQGYQETGELQQEETNDGTDA